MKLRQERYIWITAWNYLDDLGTLWWDFETETLHCTEASIPLFKKWCTDGYTGWGRCGSGFGIAAPHIHVKPNDALILVYIRQYLNRRAPGIKYDEIYS